jgi:peptide/nickel transport system substrate-binding protein
MKLLGKTMLAIALVASATTALTALSVTSAAASGVLRLDEVPVGELDPGKASDYADSMLMFNIYDTLVLPKQGEAGLNPNLAESWEAGDDSYTFKLRTDVKFQSGNALTADDVVYSLQRMQKLNQGLSYLFTNVKGATAVDEHTVRFDLKGASAPFLSALTRLPILDKKLVLEHVAKGDTADGDWGAAWLSTNAAGSGAYTVVSHNPQQETVMKRNPGYFQPIPEAAPDEVHLRYGLDAATVRAQIPRGEDDISSQWMPPEVLKALAKGGAQLLHEPGAGELYIKLNTAKAPLDDLNCRLALVNAFDYATAIKMIAITDQVSQGTPSTGPIPQGMLGALPADQTFKRDLDKAKDYLAKCKYKPADFKLQLAWVAEVPLEERFALLMQSNFSEIGIQSEIVKMPWALYSDQVTKVETTPNVSQVFVNAVSGDPDTLLYGMYHSTDTPTWQSSEHLNDANVDALLDKARTQTDIKEREATYQELGKAINALAPDIFAYDNQAVFAASDRVKVPALTDDAKQFPLPGMGFTFRLMEMTGK